MSVEQPVGRPGALLSYPNETDHRRMLAQLGNRLNQGHMNTNLYVTLDPNETETIVVDSRISIQTAALLMPRTANAAAAIPTTSITCTSGSLTISHASSAQADRTFTMAMIG